MGEINKKVKDQNHWYRQLLGFVKTVTKPEIYISAEASNNKDWRKGVVDFSISDVERGLIHVNQKIREESIYGFALRLPLFMKQALCRFDSDGHSHLNKGYNIPAGEESVKTPHFHMWDQNGREIAYKTDDLILNEDLIYKDMNVGISLFCKEFNVILRAGGSPVIITQLKLFPELTITDLHAGIKFD